MESELLRSARSLAYYDSYRRERLPGNLIQAQRDFFGAHTYERTDVPGKFVHTEWQDVPGGAQPAKGSAWRHQVGTAQHPTGD